MTQALSVELAASAVVAATGQGSAVDIEAIRRSLLVTVQTTAFTAGGANPSVVVAVQTRLSDSYPWRDAGSVSVSAVGTSSFAVGALDRYVRATWTLTNVTSATFSVSGIAHVTYCDPADITAFAVSTKAIASFSASDLVNACIAATDQADGYLNSSFLLPITAWGIDLRQACAQLAAVLLIRRRGADPSGADAVVFDGETKALAWLNRISDGKLKPPGITDSTPEVFEGGSFVVSSTSRGW